MITDYNDCFFNFLKDKITEFNIDYLKQDNVFLKNYVFLYNDLPIGLISYSVIYERIELEYIWVSVNYRKNGIASKLLDKMFEEKFDNVTLEVRSSNIAAIKLYEKYGFRIVSTRHNYYGDEDAYLMIREMM